MSKIDSKKEVEKKELLYTYWETIPLVINAEISSEEVFTHEVREMIIYYIRQGLEEKDKNGQIRIRHGFSAKELLDFVNEELDVKMKLQSMYFHIMKLQEYGLLETITTLHEGRHNVAYFGRTARSFNFENKKKEQDRFSRLFLEGSKYAQALNNDLPANLFEKFLNDYLTTLKENEIKILDWLKSNEEFIHKNNIDVAYMFSFLKRVNYYNPKLINIFQEIADLIGYTI